MSLGKLGPRMDAYARGLGGDAGRLRLLGQIPDPCPWSTLDRSLTRRRLAAAWADAYISVSGFDSGA